MKKKSLLFFSSMVLFYHWLDVSLKIQEKSSGMQPERRWN